MGDETDAGPDQTFRFNLPPIGFRAGISSLEEWLDRRHKVYEELKAKGVPEQFVAYVQWGSPRTRISFVNKEGGPGKFGKEITYAVPELMAEEELKRREDEFFASIPLRARRQDNAIAPSTAGELLACVLRSCLHEHQSASNANKRDGDKKGPPPVRKPGDGLLPPSTIAEAASDLLEDCQVCGYPPGPQLTALLQELLGTDRPRLGASREYGAKDKAAWLLAENPSLSARAIGKEVGVAHTSVTKWLKDPKFQELVRLRQNLVARLQASGQWPI